MGLSATPRARFPSTRQSQRAKVCGPREMRGAVTHRPGVRLSVSILWSYSERARRLEPRRPGSMEAAQGSSAVGQAWFLRPPRELGSRFPECLPAVELEFRPLLVYYEPLLILAEVSGDGIGVAVILGFTHRTFTGPFWAGPVTLSSSYPQGGTLLSPAEGRRDQSLTKDIESRFCKHRFPRAPRWPELNLLVTFDASAGCRWQSRGRNGPFPLAPPVTDGRAALHHRESKQGFSQGCLGPNPAGRSPAGAKQSLEPPGQAAASLLHGNSSASPLGQRSPE